MKAIVVGWEIVAPFSRGRAVSSYANNLNFFGMKFSLWTLLNASVISLEKPCAFRFSIN